MIPAKDRLRHKRWLKSLRPKDILYINDTTVEREERRERALKYFNDVMERAWGKYAENMYRYINKKQT